LIAAVMRARSSSDTTSGVFIIRDTVAEDTPANLATSRSVMLAERGFFPAVVSSVVVFTFAMHGPVDCASSAIIATL
jgi:hypothetical protein